MTEIVRQLTTEEEDGAMKNIHDGIISNHFKNMQPGWGNHLSQVEQTKEEPDKDSQKKA